MKYLVACCSLCLGLLIWTGCNTESSRKQVEELQVTIPDLTLTIVPDSLTPRRDVDTDTLLWEYNHQLIPMNYIEPPEPFPAFKEIRLE